MTVPSLLVGLGNPGPEYAWTRHNAGFLVLDRLAARMAVSTWHAKFKGMFAKGTLAGHPVAMLKPHTFMNLSGHSVRLAAAFFKIPVREICVIHDDIDLEFGMVRLKSGGGTGGHKGLNSCREQLGDSGFHRIRIGVGRPNRGSVSDYVLRPFSPEELTALDPILDRACDAVAAMVTDGIARAMNTFNQRKGVTS